MAIYDFFLSRNNGPTIENYVGHIGRLFYDSANGVIKISDGVTPGGLSIPYTIATDTVVGGVKAGPGVVINSEGQILIDSEGLEFSFGDFTGIVGSYTDETEYALLSSIKEDEDVVIASNGTGSVKVVGQFDIYKTNGSVTGSLEDEEPFFRVLDDGQVRILVPLADTTEGGMEIIGSELGTALSPGQAGTMLHLTGNADLPTRVYHDTLGDYGSYVFRRYNGSVVTPTQVLANEDIARFNWTAANDAGMPNQATAQIRVTALEDQTTTAQGSKIVFTVTPVGSPTSSRVDVATISTADGVSATKFTGPLTGNVTGKADTAGTADIATAVTLVATNSTAATHYLTFVDSATGNENVRTDTGLTYNPGTNTLTAGVGAFTTFTGKYIRTVRDAGTIADGGTLTINFSTDALVYCVWANGMTIAYSNYTAGSVVKIMARKATGSGVDTFSLGGLTAAQVSTGSTTSANVSADTTAFIELTCTGTTIGSVYAKL